MEAKFKPAVYAFGDFRLDSGERVLWRGDVPVAVAPKSLDVLLVLVERHGQLVEKDELLHCVWPDVIVEESNLSYNISVLRKLLGDGGNGRFIETVPKRGYRFVGHVKLLSLPREAGPALRPWMLIPLALPTVAAAAWLIVSHRPALERVIESSPVTAYPGSEVYPSLSPDGNQVAFSWNGPAQTDFRVYVQQLGSSVPVPLTNGPGHDLSPVWSPDGRMIAFLRVSSGDAGSAVYLLPFPGGPERKLVDLLYIRPALMEDRYGAEIAWHPGGKWLVISDRMSPGAAPGLCAVSVATGEKRMLLDPPGSPAVDLAAAFRPDGKYLAFIRAMAFGRTDLYGVNLSAAMSAQGPPVALTSHPDFRTVSPVWDPDGRDIYFLAGPFTGDLSLWRMRDASPGTVRRLPLSDPGAVFLSPPGRRPDSRLRLVYTRSLHDSNTWRIREDRFGGASVAAPFINSTRDDFNSRFSPDGRRIAFESRRSGTTEIWVCRSDGSRPMQLTNIGGAQVGGPEWAPDSERIIFHARPAGNADLYWVNASGGPVHRLTYEPSQEASPSWSRDGRWIYFFSTRGGHGGIWKMPTEGGSAVPLTSAAGGTIAMESLDGKWLYYARRRESGISLWKIPSQGGPAVQVLESLVNTRAFDLVEDGIYFIPAPAQERRTSIRFLEFSTGRTRDLAPISTTADFGISVFPFSRGLPRTILYAQLDQDGNDLMVVDPL